MQRTRIPSCLRLPGTRRWLLTTAVVLVVLCAFEGAAHAGGTIHLRATQVDAGTIQLDGVAGEWNGGMVDLPVAQRGSPDAKDLSAGVVLAYDDDNLYVGADVTDDALVGGGGDRIEITLGFGQGRKHTVFLLPGVVGKSPGRAATGTGQTIPGATVIEAPKEGGWSLEASIPWRAFPTATKVRVGLRGAVAVHDADVSASSIEAVVASAESMSYADLPALSTTPELAVAEGLLKPNGLDGTAKHNLLANVAGDGMVERVLVFGHYLVVLGPTLRGGQEFYWNDVGTEGFGTIVNKVTTTDLTGDGRDEIVLHKRVGMGRKWREVLLVYSFADKDSPLILLTHEVGISNDSGRVINDVRLAGGRIEIHPGTPVDLSQATFHEEMETEIEPLLLPWGEVVLQRYEFQGGTFVKTYEKTQEPTLTTVPAPAPSTAPQPAAKPSVDQVYAAYKKDRGKSGAADDDVTGNVAGDSTAERVMRHGRELVVMGPGFQNGAGYAFLTLSAFRDGGDIRRVKTVDLTGDGRDEIVVEGSVFANAPSEAGGGEVERSVLIVYRVHGSGIKRVLAVETARRIGSSVVEAKVSLNAQGVTISAGKAKGWSKTSYPFEPDEGTVQGIESVPVPWGSHTTKAFRWNGSAFVR